MKYLIALLCLVGGHAKAQEIKDFDRSDITAENVLEMIYEEAWEVYTGDDGKECNSSVSDFVYFAGTADSHFKIEFYADQNGEYDYGCLVGVFPCKAKFVKDNSKNWTTEISCKWY